MPLHSHQGVLPAQEFIDAAGCRVRHYTRSPAATPPPSAAQQGAAGADNTAALFACLRGLAGVPPQLRPADYAQLHSGDFLTEWILLDLHPLLPASHPHVAGDPAHCEAQLAAGLASREAALGHLLDMLLALAGGRYPAELAHAADYLCASPGGPDALWAAVLTFPSRKSLFRGPKPTDAAAAGRLATAACEAYSRWLQRQRQHAGEEGARPPEEGAAAKALLYLSAATQLAYEAGSQVQLSTLDYMCTLSRQELGHWHVGQRASPGMLALLELVAEAGLKGSGPCRTLLGEHGRLVAAAAVGEAERLLRVEVPVSGGTARVERGWVASLKTTISFLDFLGSCLKQGLLGAGGQREEPRLAAAREKLQAAAECFGLAR